MATTNHTPTLELSQYASTDKTSYLVNYNDDMLKIDTAIATDRDNITTAQNTADTAEGKADANKTSIDTLNGQINDPSGLAEQVSGNTSSINTINSLLGNGEPTTTDKTIIGAINELDVGKANKSAFTGLYLLKTHHAQVYAINDGVKTYGELMAEAVTALKTVITGLTSNQFLRVIGVDAFIPEMVFYSPDYAAGDTINIQASNAQVNLVPNSCDFWTAFFNETACKLVAGTYGGASAGFTDETNVVSGTIVRIYYDIYKKIS